MGLYSQKMIHNYLSNYPSFIFPNDKKLVNLLQSQIFLGYRSMKRTSILCIFGIFATIRYDTILLRYDTIRYSYDTILLRYDTYDTYRKYRSIVIKIFFLRYTIRYDTVYRRILYRTYRIVVSCIVPSLRRSK